MRIAAIAGSLRKDSYNRRLLAIGVSALRKSGADVDELDLREFPLAVYDGDIESEQGLPEVAWKLKSRIAACQGIVIACPEYNASIPGTFKNVIDWTSRGGSNPWQGKVIALMGASNGPWGTQRMMPHLRQSLSLLGAIVIPQQINVASAGSVWDAEGKLLDDKLAPRVEKFAREFLHVTERLRADKDH